MCNITAIYNPFATGECKNWLCTIAILQYYYNVYFHVQLGHPHTIKGIRVFWSIAKSARAFFAHNVQTAMCNIIELCNPFTTDECKDWLCTISILQCYYNKYFHLQLGHSHSKKGIRVFWIHGCLRTQCAHCNVQSPGRRSPGNSQPLASPAPPENMKNNKQKATGLFYEKTKKHENITKQMVFCISFVFS